jgi:hypothetical protein
MSYDVLDFCKVAERPDMKAVGYEPFAFEPAVIYPATIARILEVLADGSLPTELIDKNLNPDVDPRSAALMHRSRIKAIPEEAWALALKPRSEFADSPDDAALLGIRADALEAARLWFTRALKNEVGKPVGVHILKDEDYRL